jgi:hypothetical protein
MFWIRPPAASGSSRTLPEPAVLDPVAAGGHVAPGTDLAVGTVERLRWVQRAGLALAAIGILLVTT